MNAIAEVLVPVMFVLSVSFPEEGGLSVPV